VLADAQAGWSSRSSGRAAIAGDDGSPTLLTRAIYELFVVEKSAIIL